MKMTWQCSIIMGMYASSNLWSLILIYLDICLWYMTYSVKILNLVNWEVNALPFTLSIVWFPLLVWYLYWSNINRIEIKGVFILVTFWKLDSLNNKFKTTNLIGLLFANIFPIQHILHTTGHLKTSIFLWCFPSR